MYLEKIQSPEDVKKLDVEQLKVLAGEMSQPLLPIGTNTPIFIINLSSSRKVKVRRGAASCISFSAA